MSYRRVLNIVGAIVGATGMAMLLAALVSLGYREFRTASMIVLAAAVTVAAGGFAWRYTRRPGELTTREGFAAVGLSWIAISFFGALPYLLAGAVTDYTNAFFETAAGYTTTGSSIFPDPSVLDHGILFWRSLTQWLGGMGIIVLSVAILPLLGVGGVQLARAEAPGVAPDRLTPRFRETAKRLWLVYLGATVAEMILLSFGDMTIFEAVNHGLTTMATGGFSTHPQSLAGYSAYSQWVVAFFMGMAGTSFALHYRALRRPVDYVRHPEWRLYASIIVAATVVIVVGTWGGPISDVVRDAVFTSLTLITTTGYGTADFGAWSPVLGIFVVGLMFIGGMAGSTAGSVKTYRLGVLTKASRADLRRLIHPRGIFLTKFGDETVSDEIVESVQSFFLLYMFIFMTGTLLLAGVSEFGGGDLGMIESASAVATAIGNVGPGLGNVGPTSNFLGVPMLGKWLLAFIMIVGRLEIYPILLLFSRELYRR